MNSSEGAIDSVVDETKGLSWGGEKAITQGAGGALQKKLSDTLDGQKIIVRNSSPPPAFKGLIITSLNDINLDNGANENLHYYDPGKFPQVFGERPKNMFNMGDD